MLLFNMKKNYILQWAIWLYKKAKDSQRMKNRSSKHIQYNYQMV